MSTSVTPPADLTVDQLGPLGAQIGSGGQAVVYDLPTLSLPDVQGRLVYKRYKPGLAPAHGLGQIVGLRTRLLAEPAKLAFLDATTAWPVRQVRDTNGAVCGLVLPRIPDSFFHDVALPSGKTATIPLSAQFLFIPPDKALRGGTPTPTPTERLTICRDFTATLAFLHDELNVAFGDINHSNAVFRMGTEPMVMFVDCDAVRVVGGVGTVPQLNTPDWDPPEGRDVLSIVTDRYKLGLFVLRCLTPDNNSSVNRDPAWARGALDTQGLQMLTAALRGPADQRPSAEEWLRYLRRALGEALNPPTLTQVEIDRTIVAAGEPVTVRWSAQDADTIEFSGVGVAPTSVPAAAGSGTVELHPSRTGRILAVARNQLGEAGTQTGPVAVFDVPSFHDIPVPMPRLEIPRIAPADLPPVAAVLPPFPAGVPVPIPAMADLAGVFGEPDTSTPPEPLDLGGPPPVFGFGVSAVPIDIAAILSAVPDPGPDLEVHS